MRKFYPLCLVLSIGLTSSAQITAIKSNFGDPGGTSLGNRVVFVNGSTGELGSTDGTPGGTVAIPTSSVILSGMNAALLNGKIVFTGFNAVTGAELYSSDGTIAGSTLIKDINPGPTGSNPQGSSEGYTVVNGTTLYFTADDGINGRELWKTDGTTVGTVLVKDLNAVSINFPMVFGPYTGNTLYFTVNTATSGLELWKSDGTSGGTVMVKEITAGIASTTFSNMFVMVGSNIYFVASDGVNGAELWRSDGSDAGTFMLADLAPGSAGSFDFSGINWNWNFHVKNNILYFSPNNLSGSKIYKTDGTVVGTTLVTDLNPLGGYTSLWDAIDWGSLFIFQANGELYSSDGSAAGTTLLKDINPGSAGSNPRILVPREGMGDQFASGLFAGGRFFFLADDGTNGNELWVSDGTAAGTMLVKDINPGTASSFPTNDVQYFYTKYKFLFSASDGTSGYELWQTDGTTGGTSMVMDIYPGATSSDIEFFGVAEATNHVVFRSTDASGADINVLDATVVPFPLTLTDFTAEWKGKAVELNWKSQQEVNFSHYNIQRSITGTDFTTIATVNGKGGTENEYRFTDGQTGNAAVYYYRLQMVGKDGKETFSKIVMVKTRPGFSFTLHSTRSEAIVNMQDVNGPVTIKLVTSNGTTVFRQQKNITAGEQIHIPVSQLPHGVYMIAVEYNNTVQTQQFVR